MTRPRHLRLLVHLPSQAEEQPDWKPRARAAPDVSFPGREAHVACTRSLRALSARTFPGDTGDEAGLDSSN